MNEPLDDVQVGDWLLIVSTMKGSSFLLQQVREVLATRGGFNKRTTAKELSKLSDAHRRSILLKREYHAARRDKSIANPYAHAKAIVEKMLANA
jgi:hypothetical protein